MLRYEPINGLLFWKPRSPDLFSDTKNRSAEHICANWNSRYADKEALSAINEFGYKHGSIFNKSYRAHRVIWAMETGSWPAGLIDHINGKPADNRLENLREATRSQNGMNRGAQKNSTSGFKGVTYDKKKQRWASAINLMGKKKFLGYYDKPQDAHDAYARAAKIYHADFSRAN